MVATSKFALRTVRWYSATRKHLFLSQYFFHSFPLINQPTFAPPTPPPPIMGFLTILKVSISPPLPCFLEPFLYIKSSSWKNWICSVRPNYGSTIRKLNIRISNINAYCASLYQNHKCITQGCSVALKDDL